MQTDPRIMRPEGLAVAMIVSSLALLILNTLVISLRIWVRTGMFDAKKLWGWDDTVICVAYVSMALFCNVEP